MIHTVRTTVIVVREIDGRSDQKPIKLQLDRFYTCGFPRPEITRQVELQDIEKVFDKIREEIATRGE